MKLSQETIDSEIQFAKTASKSCSTRKKQSVVYTNKQQNKTEFKELEIERLYTIVYTGSLQT